MDQAGPTRPLTAFMIIVLYLDRGSAESYSSQLVKASTISPPAKRH